MSEYLNRLFSLEGKTALVTGGAKGLGLIMAEALVKAGATVIIASRSFNDCQTAAQSLAEHGQCIALAANLSTIEGISALAEEVAKQTNRLDILINNSGTTWGASIESYPPEQWDKVMDLNVKTPFYLMQKLLPLMEAAASPEDPAKVINIGSIAGLSSAITGAYAYGASKAAVLHLTKGLAKELAPRHLTVNAIAPGYFPTKMTKHIHSNEALEQQVLSLIPLNRYGKSEELAALTIYLSGKSSAYVTGQVFPLDGGALVN